MSSWFTSVGARGDPAGWPWAEYFFVRKQLALGEFYVNLSDFRGFYGFLQGFCGAKFFRCELTATVMLKKYPH